MPPPLAPQRALRAGASRQEYFEQVWDAHVMAEQSPSSETAFAMSADAQGNIYTTGYAGKKPFGTDYFTAKYSPAGNYLWTVRYGGDVLGDNCAYAIVVDSLGNVYITGTSMGTLSMDVATIKYNALGVQQWIQRYESPAQSSDGGYAIGLDSARNVYVAAMSAAEDGRFDCLVLKYSNNGDPLWSTRHDHQGFGDYADAMVVGRRGYVAVAVTSINSDTTESILTLVYRPDGTPLWSADFSGPVDGVASPSAIAFDVAGNTIVAGTCDGWGTGYDLVLLRYDSQGQLQGIGRYNGPGDKDDAAMCLATDHAGNVIVGGYTTPAPSNEDFLVVKYDQFGVQRWVATYDGTANSYDAVTAIFLDPLGEIYASGTSDQGGLGEALTTVKYDAGGNQQWVAAQAPAGYEFNLLAGAGRDVVGNIYLAGSSLSGQRAYDIAMVKFDGSGGMDWEVEIDGAGTSIDNVRDAVVDARGNVYLAADSDGPDGHQTILTAKVDSAGVNRWQQIYSSPAGLLDYPVDIAVDGDGSVYVVGVSMGNGTGLDYVTLKYDSDGNLLWDSRYNGVANNDDEPVGIALDEVGNVYVAGSSANTSAFGYATVRYAPLDGKQMWETRFDNPPLGAVAQAIVLDKSGGINVTGFASGADGTLDFATVKYNALGQTQWTSWFASSPPLDDYPNSVAADNTGRVFVTGATVVDKTPPYWSFRAETVKYTSTGAEEWRVPYENPPGSNSSGYDVVLDNSGNVYVVGLLQGTPFDAKFLTIKYNAAGFPDWAVTFGADGSRNYAADIALDMKGNAYVWGESYGLIGAGSPGARVVKYGPNGDLLGSAGVRAFNGADLAARTLTVDHNGDLILTGTTYGFGWSIMSAYKLHGIATSAEGDAGGIPQEISLEQCYPNPFNASTTIKFELPGSSVVRLSVFDMLGREVSVFVNERRDAGVHEVKCDGSNLASGVYFYRLQAGDVIQSKRMLILK